jgi:hypothetical protein
MRHRQDHPGRLSKLSVPDSLSGSNQKWSFVAGLRAQVLQYRQNVQ